MAYFWQPRWREKLRTGAWLTADRIRGYSLILLGFYAMAVAVWIVQSHALVGPDGKPVGTDFSSFYAAGSMALEGRAHEVYDMAAHYAREQQIFGDSVPYYAWFYPPIFLLVAAPLALLPYLIALAIWQTATLAFYLAVIGAILKPARRLNPDLDRLWMLPALAFPAVFINLGHGQNGFLTAGLFGAALLTLTTRPAVAGILFGCLAYKPQFALVIPVALAAAGQWRAIAIAAIAVIVLAGASCVAFGPEVWFGFASSLDESRRLLLEQGFVGFEKLQSVFAVVRMWDGELSLAYLVQAIVSVAVIGSVAWVWHCAADRDIKAAILTIAALLASPHTLDYDLMIVGIAIAFMAGSGFTAGFRSYDISLLAAAWTVPLLARTVAGATGIPIGFLLLLLLYTYPSSRGI